MAFPSFPTIGDHFTVGDRVYVYDGGDIWSLFLVDNNIVPITRTINTKPLSTDVTLTASDVGADAAGTAGFLAAILQGADLGDRKAGGYVGFASTPKGLPGFKFSTKAIRNIVLWGDSLVEGPYSSGVHAFGPSFKDLATNTFPGTQQPGGHPLLN